MTDDVRTWAILTFAAIGVIAAVVAFLRRPPELRYRVRRKSLTEQLRELPESAGAVIIKGDRRRAFIRSIPYILIGVALVGFSLWMDNTSNPECVRLYGFNAAYLSLVLFCYGLPFGFLVVSLLFMGAGLKTIRTGYFPPLDSVVFNDTIAKKGTLSLLRGIVLLALPVVALFVVYLGHNAYTAVADGRGVQEIAETLEAKCARADR